jgi:ABC-type glycerol-3-phosphate transport system substrate-binding protein
MKKLLALVSMMILGLGLTACGQKEDAPATEETTTMEAPAEAPAAEEAKPAAEAPAAEEAKPAEEAPAAEEAKPAEEAAK